MVTRVGINGFGRIGRQLVRAIVAMDAPVEIVAVNDLSDSGTLADLLTFDSVHGRLDPVPTHSGDHLSVGNQNIRVFTEMDPTLLPWSHLEVDLVVEATGRFTSRQDASQHLHAGAPHVIVAAPSDDADITVCMGVNDSELDTSKHEIISNASCTTNCLAPMVKVLDDAFGLTSGFVTTVHAYTNDQNLLDLVHKDRRRGRAAALNITPATTGAARAIGKVMPTLAGRLDGVALRVPVPVGSITDLVCSLRDGPNRDEINAAFEKASTGPLGNYLQYTESPYVSSDIVGNPHSCVFSAIDTMVGPEHIKVLGWYDNEWGYANRLADLICRLGSTEPSAA